MPTRRKKTTNKSPSAQEASLVLGIPRNQETKKVSNQSILMDYLLKCIQTQQSLCRPELQYTMMKNKVKRKSTH